MDWQKYELCLNNEVNEKIRKMTQAVLDGDDFNREKSRWAPFLYRPGAERFPSLLIEDLSGIPHISGIPGIEWYQLRARVRAFSGDFYLTTHEACDDYESYNRDFLKLGASYCLTVRNAAHPFYIARGCMQDKEVMRQLKDVVSTAGGLLIHPYMVVYDVWELAEMLKTDTGGEIRVLAPPPHVTRFVNDKKEFHDVVCGLLGPDLVPETCFESILVGIRDRVRRLARRGHAVVIKLKNCASSMGNKIFGAGEVSGMSDEALEAEITDFLGRFGIALPHEVLVSEWRDDVVMSPSAQLWIPGEPRLPVVEGIFDQILEGEEKVFAGSVPSSLPADVRETFAAASFKLACFFQRLGYRGRCSFDAIVTDGLTAGGNAIATKNFPPGGNAIATKNFPPGGNAIVTKGITAGGNRPLSLKFVECNGRWGGTSIPMFFSRRIFSRNGHGHDRRFTTYIAVDYTDKRLKGADFSLLRRLFNGYLYNPSTGQGNVVLYNTGCLKEFGKFDVILAGENREVSRNLLHHELPALFDACFS